MVDSSLRHGRSFAETVNEELEAFETGETTAEIGRAVQSRWDSLFTFTRRRHLICLSAAIFFSILSGLIIPAMSIFLGNIFHTFTKFGHGELDDQNLTKEVWDDVVRLVLLGIVGWTVNGLFFACWLYFGESQAQVARMSIFEGLLEREISWYDMLQHGEASLVSSCQTQIKELQIAVSQPLGYFLQAAVTSTTCLAIALYHSWDLTLIILAGFPLAAMLLNRLSMKVAEQANKQKEYLAESSKVINRIIISIDTIKAFNAELNEKGIYTRAITSAGTTYQLQASNASMQIGLIQFVTFAMFVQGFWYGNLLVNKWEAATPGDVMTTFWSCLMATQSFQMILPQLVVIEKGQISGANLRVLLMKLKKGVSRRNNTWKECINTASMGDIKFHRVSFAYPSRPYQLVLRDVTLSIPIGTTIWVIGRSGSGKSTLANLLLGVYQPSSGLITIGNAPIHRLSINWIRDQITWVQQHSVLFDDTVFLNVALGQKFYERARPKDIQQAIRISSLEDTIESLPSHDQTVVGIGGRKLSGGQRQRIALARAIFRNSNCLILDEAFAALDSNSRSITMDNIRRWRKGKTTIIITHDLSQIPPDDLVYVLNDGELVVGGLRRELEELGDFATVFSSTKECVADTAAPSMVEREEILTPYDSLTCLELPLETNSGIQLANPKPNIHSADSMGNERMEEQCISPTEIELRKRTRCGVIHYMTSYVKDLFDIKRSSHENKTLIDIMKSIWPSLGASNKFRLCFGAVAALVHAIATPVFSFSLANLLSAFFHPESEDSKVKKWSLVVFGIAVVDGFCGYYMHYLLETAGQTWVDTLRVTAVQRILGQPRLWFDTNKNTSSRIMEDLEKNAEEMRDLVGKFAGYAFVATVMLTTGIIWSFIECWQLTLVGICVLPVMYGITRGFSWTSDHWEEQCNEAAENCGQVLLEAIENIKTVKVLSLDRYFWNKYNSLTRLALEKGLKRSIVAGIGFGISDSSILFVLALIFYGGSVFVATDEYKLDNVFTVFAILSFSLANANSVIGMIPQISSCKDTACRVLHLADLDMDSHERKGSNRIDIAGRIGFHSVTFSYGKKWRPVLQDVNFSIRWGECVAIVGASGSGKSTLLSLLQKLHQPSFGFISIDGRDLAHLHTRHYRSQVSVVSQHPIIFDGTITSNMTYGELPPYLEVTQHAIEEAAKMAGMDEFINSLPLKYDTPIHHGSLSGGQAQRLALARALLRKPRILILDEITSGLDTESARVVGDSIRRLVEKGTSIVMVTHSEDMIRTAADRVVVLKGGKVVQEGTYEELTRIGVPQKQTAGVNWRDTEKGVHVEEDTFVENEFRRIFGNRS